MWAKFRFTGTFICSIISDNFFVFIRKQPLLKFTGGLTQAKCGLATFKNISKKLHQIDYVMDNWANPRIL